MQRGIIITGVIVVALSAIALRLNANKEKAGEEIQRELGTQPVNVQAANITRRSVALPITATGTVEAGQTLSLVSETDGKVARVLFGTGDRVVRGQPLARLETTLKQTQHQLNQLNYEKARRDYERLAALYRENNAAQVDVENARVQMETSENQLAITAEQLRQAVIHSPINGIVSERKMGLGDYLQPGAPVATIVDLSNVVIRVNLPEKDVIQVHKGDSVAVQAAVYPGKTFTGVIRAIIPQATQAKTFPVEIAVRNPEKEPLLVGMEVRVTLNQNRRDSILALPRTALTGDYANPTVFLIRDKKAVKQSLSIGKEYGAWLEVTSGLQPGDLVIVAGQQNVAPGAAITSYSVVNQ